MDQLMSTEVIKVPLLVELIGEPESGKTHLACLFPKPALFDTSAKKEAYVVMRKLFPAGEWKKRWFPVRALQDMVEGLKYVELHKEEFATVVVDTSPDLRDLAAKEYLGELNKDGKKRLQLMPEEYKNVNVKVNEKIVDKVATIDKGLGMNLVFTSQMADEWIDRKPTGKRVRKGIPTMNYQADIRVLLRLENEVDPKTMLVTGKVLRRGIVVKNRFKDRTAEEWIPLMASLDWKGILGLTDLKEGEMVE